MTVHSAGGPAARAFATDIAGWEWHDDEQLEIMLFSVGAFIEKAGTGGGLFRRLLASILHGALVASWFRCEQRIWR